MVPMWWIDQPIAAVNDGEPARVIVPVRLWQHLKPPRSYRTAIHWAGLVKPISKNQRFRQPAFLLVCVVPDSGCGTLVIDPVLTATVRVLGASIRSFSASNDICLNSAVTLIGLSAERDLISKWQFKNP
ncbi:hypothetical protein THIOSC15_320009 [uncultured Thiomicrorhabdus sp.]